jgi:hypothetical protein
MMNKRARQLAKPHLEKKWYSKKYGESVQEDHYFFLPEDLDEFARALILEAADVANKHWIQHKGCCAHFSIRQHFGINDWPRQGEEPQ